VGDWYGVLELVTIVLLKRASSQNATRCVDLGFDAPNDIIDLSVVRNYNRKQVGFQHDGELYQAGLAVGDAISCLIYRISMRARTRVDSRVPTSMV
jgi:hypothetical protein